VWRLTKLTNSSFKVPKQFIRVEVSRNILYYEFVLKSLITNLFPIDKIVHSLRVCSLEWVHYEFNLKKCVYKISQQPKLRAKCSHPEIHLTFKLYLKRINSKYNHLNISF